VPGPAGQVVVVDRRDGGLRAFLAPPGPCPVVDAGAGFARPCTSQRWDAGGAPAGGRSSAALHAVPVAFARGDLYVRPG
jgi:hypothetical protein